MIPALIFLIPLVLAAAFLSARLIPHAMRRAVRRGFVDRPDQGRKGHTRNVPPIGGLVIVPIFLLLAPFMGLSVVDHAAFYAATVLLLTVGVWDDRFSLRAEVKFAAQIIAALLVAVLGTSVTGLGHMFGVDHPVEMGVIAIPFTVAALLFFVNAVNMMDGVDGLSGSVLVAMLFWLGVAALLAAGGGVLAAPIFMLMGLLIGFLVHNMRYPGHARATVFMGDAGAMSLALIVAYLAILLSQGPAASLPPIGVALLILLPIMDTFALFIARFWAGRGALMPGQDHVHHRLLARGFSATQVAVCCAGATFVLGAVAVFGPAFGLGEGAMTAIWAGAMIAHTAYLLTRLKKLYHV